MNTGNYHEGEVMPLDLQERLIDQLIDDLNEGKPMEVSGIALGYEQTAQAQYPGIALPEEWETS